MSLAAFSFWSLRALLRLCCHWLLQSTVVSSKKFSDWILHFLSISWPLKCFSPRRSCWPLTLCKCIDVIQGGSRSWGMLMACLSRRSWCLVIGPTSFYSSTTLYKKLCSFFLKVWETKMKSAHSKDTFSGFDIVVLDATYYSGLITTPVASAQEPERVVH